MENKDNRTLEQVFEELEQLIGKMETEVSLEESFQLYHQGMEMLKLCNDKIDKVEKQMLVLDSERNEYDS